MDGRLLLVEDDSSIREVASLGLRGAGFGVESAANGREGLARFRAETRDARAIAGPLERSGLERWAPAWLLGFDLAGHGVIAFGPVLPGGEWSCTPCG